MEENHGLFEYVPLPLTSSIYRLSYYQIYSKVQKSGITDETLKKIIPKSTWKFCPEAAGTVIFVDTQNVLHHGTLRTQERSVSFMFTPQN